MPENRKDTEIYIRKLHEMLPELKEKYHISYLGIFGSYIRGEQKLGSDLDILVEFSKTPTIFKFVNLENHLSEALGVKVDLVMKDALKPNIGKHIMREVEAVWRGIKIREAKDYVKDIYDAIEAAEDWFASGWTFEDFAADRKTQFAVIRALEIIGEATKNIPYEAREKYPSVPWKDLAGIWDKLIHAYFGVNLKVVWLSVKEGIPEAKPDIKRILDEMWIRKTSPRGKDHFDQKRSCKGLVLKLQKLWIKKKVDSNNKIF